MNSHTINRWPRSKSYLDRLVTFCFDRADLAFGLADLPENPIHIADQDRAQRWIRRGNIFAKVRAGWYND